MAPDVQSVARAALNDIMAAGVAPTPHADAEMQGAAARAEAEPVPRMNDASIGTDLHRMDFWSNVSWDSLLDTVITLRARGSETCNSRPPQGLERRGVSCGRDPCRDNLHQSVAVLRPPPFLICAQTTRRTERSEGRDSGTDHRQTLAPGVGRRLEHAVAGVGQVRTRRPWGRTHVG